MTFPLVGVGEGERFRLRVSFMAAGRWDKYELQERFETEKRDGKYNDDVAIVLEINVRPRQELMKPWVT